MRNTNVQQLLKDLITNWKKALKPKDISISYEIKDINFNCFPYELESILNNLIANSASSFDLKQSNKKNIDISILPIDIGIIIKYHDNGIGLSDVYKKNPRLILEPFESDKRSSDGEIIGTGMGMWIINRIVNDYNGSIDLSENRENKTGFFINITLKGKIKNDSGDI